MRVAIVGASARAAAHSAIRAGQTPITADLFADQDLTSCCRATAIKNYPYGLRDWLKTVDVEGWFYTGALENYPDLVDEMAIIAPLLGNPGEVLRAVRSPLKLQATLKNAGLLFPETRDSCEGLPIDGTWLIKTYRGSSGSGVKVYKGEPEDLVVYQQRITGTPISANFVAAKRSVLLLGINRQLINQAWTHARPFQYAGSIGPWETSQQDTIDHIGKHLANEFKLTGQFGVDLIENLEGIWTIEVNPRYTASMEITERVNCRPVTSGGNKTRHPDGTLPAAQFRQEGAKSRNSAADKGVRGVDGYRPPLVTGLQHIGKAILFARAPFELSADNSNWLWELALSEPWPQVADVPYAGTRFEQGNPVVTLFAEGESCEEVEAKLREFAGEVERRIEHKPE